MIGIGITALILGIIFGGLAWAGVAKTQAKTFRILAGLLIVLALILIAAFFLMDNFQSP